VRYAMGSIAFLTRTYRLLGDFLGPDASTGLTADSESRLVLDSPARG